MAKEEKIDVTVGTETEKSCDYILGGIPVSTIDSEGWVYEISRERDPRHLANGEPISITKKTSVRREAWDIYCELRIRNRLEDYFHGNAVALRSRNCVVEIWEPTSDSAGNWKVMIPENW